MGSVDDDRSLVDHASAPIETPCGFIHKPCRAATPLPGDFLFARGAIALLGASDWPAALVARQSAAKSLTELIRPVCNCGHRREGIILRKESRIAHNKAGLTRKRAIS